MIYFTCMDCKKSFAVIGHSKKPYCPYCGDNVSTQKVRHDEKSYSPWSESEEILLIELSKTKFLYEIADIMGRTENSIRRKIEELRKKGFVTHSRRTIKKYV